VTPAFFGGRGGYIGPPSRLGGLLSLALVRGESIIGRSTMEPYVVAHLGDVTYHTATAATDRLQWGQRLSFFVDEATTMRGVLRFEVFDKDVYNGDAFIGDAEVAIHDLVHALGSRGQAPFRIQLFAKEETIHGRLRNGMLYLEVSMEDQKHAIEQFFRHWLSLLDVSQTKRVNVEDVRAMLPLVTNRRLTKYETMEMLSTFDPAKGAELSLDSVCAFLASMEGQRFVDRRSLAAWVVATLSLDRPNEAPLDPVHLVLSAASEWTPRTAIEAVVDRYGRSRHVLVWDRRRGALFKEEVPPLADIGLRLLCQENFRLLIRGDAREVGVSRAEAMGKLFDSRNSVARIPGFIRQFGIDVSDIAKPVEKYISLNHFFARALRPGTRPITAVDDPTVAVQPTDGRVLVYESVDLATKFWIKGKSFTLEKLLGSRLQAQRFEGGSISIHRLAPQDYHRFHSPVFCTVVGTQCVAGALWPAHPVTVNAVDVLTENKRNVVYLRSEAFGTVAHIQVGTYMVGSILYSSKRGADAASVVLLGKDRKLRKGQDMGCFRYGGSTVVCVWEKGRIRFDADLVQRSLESTETLVRMGERLGVAPAGQDGQPLANASASIMALLEEEEALPPARRAKKSKTKIKESLSDDDGAVCPCS